MRCLVNRKVKTLVITNELLTTCGVSKHLLYFLTEAKKSSEINFIILCGGGDAVESFRKVCDDIFIYPQIRHEKRSIINFFNSIFYLLKLQTKYKFDLFHSHYHYAANIAQIVSRLTKTKTINTVHGIIEPIGKLNHYPSDYFIAVNEHVYDYLIKQRNKNEKNVKLIRSGIPIPLKSQKAYNGKLKIISAGRLIPEKGFDIFIEAISKLNTNIREKTEFIIAGKGQYESELKNLTAKLNVNISFIGQLEDLNTELMKTNIFVTATQSEGFPMTIIEAALNKNLIISSNFLGYDSILKDNINCLVFNLNDSDDLVHKLEYAIENFEDMDQIIENGYQDAIKEFNIDKMVGKTISFYKEIL